MLFWKTLALMPDSPKCGSSVSGSTPCVTIGVLNPVAGAGLLAGAACPGWAVGALGTAGTHAWSSPNNAGVPAIAAARTRKRRLETTGEIARDTGNCDMRPSLVWRSGEGRGPLTRKP